MNCDHLMFVLSYQYTFMKHFTVFSKLLMHTSRLQATVPPRAPEAPRRRRGSLRRSAYIIICLTIPMIYYLVLLCYIDIYIYIYIILTYCLLLYERSAEAAAAAEAAAGEGRLLHICGARSAFCEAEWLFP